MPGYIAILPDPDDKLRSQGHRLRVDLDDEASYLDLTEEKVWPEKVHDPHAHCVAVTDRIILHRDGIVWLHGRLGEVIAQLEKEGR